MSFKDRLLVSPVLNREIDYKFNCNISDKTVEESSIYTYLFINLQNDPTTNIHTHF